MKPNCSALSVSPDITLYHSGPSLDLGPLPSFFYFSLSGPDSLCLDPFNQPVQFLQGKMIRVFSMTLPGHEPPLEAKDALQVLVDDFAKGRDPIGAFLDSFETALAFAIKEQFVDPKKMTVGGLSRGGGIAFHAAARDERLKQVLAFSPVTKLSSLKEFKSLNITSYDAPKLVDKRIRIYISNNDTRVGTRNCFDFVEKLVESSPKTELFIYPAIGHQGHGTPPEIFQAGANWI